MKPQGLAEWTQNEVETLLHSVGRYTRFVRSTKVVLGLMALVLIGMMVFYLITKNENAGIRVAFTSIEKGVASPTKMLNARFHGLDKDNQPFNITALTATQGENDLLYLDKVTADITLKTGPWLSLSANSGVLDTKTRGLDLKGAIEMFDDEGYEFRTEAMHVDIAQKGAVTHEVVTGQGPLGKLRAQGAVVNGKDETITFGGRVFVTVYPPQDNKAAGKPKGKK